MGAERWSRRAEVLWRACGEAVVLLPAQGRSEPLVLTAPGRRLWELLAEPQELPALTCELARLLGVRDGSVMPDVHHLLLEMAALDLVEPSAP